MAVVKEVDEAQIPILNFAPNDSPDTPDAGISIFAQSDDKFYSINDAGEIASIGGAGAGGHQFAIIKEIAASGANGGSFFSGAWRTRVLDTEIDPDNIVSLANNQFTPIAGNYILVAEATAVSVNVHQSRLENVTQASTVEAGTSEYALDYATVSTKSVIRARFVANGTDAYEIQHRCSASRSSYGFGYANSNGGISLDNVYTQLLLVKVD